MPEISPLGVLFWGKGIFFFLQEDNVTLVIPTCEYRKYHNSSHFLITIVFFHFPSKQKISYFLEKRNTIFPDITIKILFRREFFGKTIFSEQLKKILYFQVFFWESVSFLLCLKNKIIFSGKGKIIFSDDTRKIIFQCNFFEKNSFSKHLQKENMVFRVVDTTFPSCNPWRFRRSLVNKMMVKNLKQSIATSSKAILNII